MTANVIATAERWPRSSRLDYLIGDIEGDIGIKLDRAEGRALHNVLVLRSDGTLAPTPALVATLREAHARPADWPLSRLDWFWRALLQAEVERWAEVER